jgi:hypothetical protein
MGFERVEPAMKHPRGPFDNARGAQHRPISEIPVHASHFVTAGNFVRLPPPDAPFRFRVGAPPGLEQIRAIATLEPNRIHRDDFRGQATTVGSVDDSQTRGLAVELRAKRKRITPERWAETVIAVEVRPQLDSDR